MPVVGLAEVLVGPTFKGLQKDIGAEIVGAGDSAPVKKAGIGIGKKLKVAAAVGLGGASTLLGTALTKGFGRLQAIENARAKLTGLGHDAQSVEKIMANATAAVKGTAFGLGDAATTAANLVAAGIKPGKDLEKTLTLVGDAATIAGVEFNDMSSVFGKAAASNKVQMDIIGQLHDMGVPALQLIAKEMGVTAAEASSMASAGEVDFATFSRAMQEGLGGSAQKSGETLQGAFANSMAAIGRFGANLMSGVYPKLRDFFSGFIGFMEPLEEKAKVVGEAIGVFIEKTVTGIQGLYDLLVKGDFTGAFREAFGVEEDSKLVGFLLGVRDGLISTGEWFQKNKAWIEPLTVAVAAGAVAWKLYNMAVGGWSKIGALIKKITEAQTIAQWALNSALLANPIALVVAAVVGLVAAFVYLWNTNEGFRNFFIGAWEKIKSVIGAVGSFISGVFDSISGWITNTLGPAFSWLYDSVIKPVWDAIARVFSGANETVQNTIGNAFTWLRDSVVTPVWNTIQSVIQTSWNQGIKPVLESIVSGLTIVGDFLKSVFGPVFSWLYDKIIKPIWDLIKWQIDFVANVLLLAFDLIVYGVKNYLAPAFSWLYDKVIKPVWTGIQSAVKSAWAAIKAIFTTIVNVVKQSLAVAFTWLRDSVIKPVWNGIVSSVKGAWTLVKGVFTAITTFVRGALSTAFTWFRDSVIKPVWTTIKTNISTWWTGVKIIFGAVKTFIQKTLAPVFTWFRDKAIKPVWEGIKNTIRNVWNNGIKPVFQTLGNFIKDKVVPAFKSGVDAIGKAWGVLKKAAGTPVYFVLETIYNKGIKATFDKVAKAIGSKANLPAAKTGNIPHFAKGGLHKGGWALVGEEGPELVNFSQPGRVYTADETRAMLAGKDQAPLGALDSLRAQGKDIGGAENGIGGFGETVFGGLQKAGSWVVDKAKQATDFVRGGLAKAAGLVLNPLRDLITSKIDGSNIFGSIVKSAAKNAIDSVIKWIKGKDDEVSADGSFEGAFTGNNGGFFRPVGGRITSTFGASRGQYPHAGTDLAVPIGTAVRAAWNGVVKKAGWNIVTGRTGIGMLLGHANGKSTYYGHLSRTIAKPGQQVKAGQEIAKSGNTGNSTGPHLHFETWQNGKPYNNIGLFDNGGVLPPGLTAAMNLTGKPEAILTNAQWRTMSQLATQGTRNTFPEQMKLIVGEHEFTAYVAGVTDSRMREAKRSARRGNRQLTGLR